MKPDGELTAVLYPYYVQFRTHGCHYNGPLKEIDGEWYFKFYGDWHKVNDYVTETTSIRDLRIELNLKDEDL